MRGDVLRVVLPSSSLLSLVFACRTASFHTRPAQFFKSVGTLGKQATGVQAHVRFAVCRQCGSHGRNHIFCNNHPIQLRIKEPYEPHSNDLTDGLAELLHQSTWLKAQSQNLWRQRCAGQPKCANLCVSHPMKKGTHPNSTCITRSAFKCAP